VLANKPMLFLSSSELSTCAYGLHITVMAAELGHVPLDIDGYVSLPELPSLVPDPLLYSRYTNSYLCCSDSAESNSWQAFIDYMHAEVGAQSCSRGGQDAV
jgi:hypothetical protein